MNAAFVQDAISALLGLFDMRDLSFDRGADELRKAQLLRLDSPGGLFGAAWRVANGANALASREQDRLRLALLSTAYIGYQHCLGTEPKFRDSFEQTRLALPGAVPLQESEIIDIFAETVVLSSADDAPNLDDQGAGEHTEFDRDGANIAAVFNPSEVELAPKIQKRRIFTAPPLKNLRERFEDLTKHFPAAVVGEDGPRQESALKIFREALGAIMGVADLGRTFTEFALLEQDLRHIEPRLMQLKQSDDPRAIQERARQSRGLAEAIDFGSASPEDYRYARSAWLLSAFWNSQLARYWPASRPHVVYDFLGYLTTIQAELRYSDADFLLLLRVSFSITRIASHDGLMPYQFLSTAPDRAREWLQHTIGTILATAGPGRVAPSRVSFDARLVEVDRRDYATTLLRHWKSESDRAAATTMLLEAGAWDVIRAKRLLEQILPQETADFQIWVELIETMASRSKRVRVVRPNPWAPGSKKAITVEREAVATLAADVVDRHYNVLEGDISLKGHDFRERRVPTYVCSAEFGPLGLFKLDTADRIGREVDNFAKYAQRLHPRYRASRCDQSKAVITEPDDDKQFVQGALTSYVFTEDETPKTLNAWFLAASLERTASLCDELFERALRPWYGHAASATIDLFGEFAIFNHGAIERLLRECRTFHSLELNVGGADESLGCAIRWLSSLLGYLEAGDVADPTIAHLASELQVLRSYRSVCHGDLHLDNVLVVGKAGAEYPCIIDFEATHEGYILKDFGRFVAAMVCRTFEWTSEECRILEESLPLVLFDWSKQIPESDVTPNVRKILNAVGSARKGILRAWQAGSYPSKIELVTALVASFLPYARYPDTLKTNVRLCLELSGRFIGDLR